MTVLKGSLRVDVVAEGEDGSLYSAQQPCRFAVGLEIASGDVSRSDQRHRLRGAGHCRQHDYHTCQQHRRGNRTDNKNGLTIPSILPCVGWRRKVRTPVTQRGFYDGMQELEQLPRTP